MYFSFTIPKGPIWPTNKVERFFLFFFFKERINGLAQCEFFFFFWYNMKAKILCYWMPLFWIHWFSSVQSTMYRGCVQLEAVFNSSTTRLYCMKAQKCNEYGNLLSIWDGERQAGGIFSLPPGYKDFFCVQLWSIIIKCLLLDGRGALSKTAIHQALYETAHIWPLRQ